MNEPNLPFTGERIVEGGTPERIWQDHLARYTFSVPFVLGRRVLDAACGTGYGTSLLAENGAADVTGVDLSDEATTFAHARYARSNLNFARADVSHLPFEDGAFDVVTSFETIEHVPDAEAALAELSRVLKPLGLLLISTPNRVVTSPGRSRHQPPENRWHRVEFTRDEFDALLAPDFAILERYGQRMVPSLFYRPTFSAIARRAVPHLYAPKHGSPILAPLSLRWEARYMIYMCQKR